MSVMKCAVYKLALVTLILELELMKELSSLVITEVNSILVYFYRYIISLVTLELVLVFNAK